MSDAILQTHHEVALDERNLVCQALFFRVPDCSLDLITVIVQTHDIATGEGSNLSCWTSHAAAHI
jgi:hypothetical protein